jgi:hypothetical protein
MGSADALERAQHGFKSPDIRSVVNANYLQYYLSVTHFTQNGSCTEQWETTFTDTSGPSGGIDRIPSTCDDRDRGHWYPKSRVFLLRAIAHLADT